MYRAGGTSTLRAFSYLPLRAAIPANAIIRIGNRMATLMVLLIKVGTK